MKPLSIVGVRSALIIAPHPDDETIGAYGLIRALRIQSARVHVLVVTDGAASHPGSVRWPRHRLIKARRRETRAAMGSVGVTARNITFLGLSDGGLSDVGDLAARAVRRAVMKIGSCDLLVLPADDDDHPDHRVVAASVSQYPGRMLRYLVWPKRARPARRASHYLRLGHRAAAKRGAIRSYRSQMGAISDDPNGFAISRAELNAFAGAVERFREVRR